MNEPDSPKPWPPREGKKFFLLWMIAEVFLAIVQRFVTPLMFKTQGVDWNLWAAQAVLAAAAAGWTGYLLFRFGWRLAAWAAMPVVLGGALMAWYSAQGGKLGLLFLSQALSLIVPLGWLAVQAALMIGVRQRPWAWLVAGVAVQLLNVAGIFAIGVLDSFFHEVAYHIPAVSVTQLTTAAHSGLWLLGAAVTAAVLAWWMPPITRESGAASPPASGSSGV